MRRARVYGKRRHEAAGLSHTNPYPVVVVTCPPRRGALVCATSYGLMNRVHFSNVHVSVCVYVSSSTFFSALFASNGVGKCAFIMHILFVAWLVALTAVHSLSSALTSSGGCDSMVRSVVVWFESGATAAAAGDDGALPVVDHASRANGVNGV